MDAAAKPLKPKGRPTEKWISHDATPEQFGEAMMLCADASGSCATTGKCTFGDCFRSDGSDYQSARRILTKLIGEQSDSGIRSWLVTARDAIDRQYRREA